MVRKSKLGNLTKSEMVESFLDRWVHEWSEAENYNSAELNIIKRSLFEEVLDRFEETNKVSFTSSEMERAINVAKESLLLGSEPPKPYDVKPGLDIQCSQYINLFLGIQDFNTDFSNQEYNLLWGKLYVRVFNRYVDMGYTCLAINKKELNEALESVYQKRHKDSVNAAMDRRDEDIREKRKQYGVLSYHFHSMSDE